MSNKSPRPTGAVPLEELLPRWRSYTASSSRGRDPLGLSPVSNRITNFLLTGIITTTDRARYYSFLCWALWHMQQNNAVSHRSFMDGLRRREAAFALATLFQNEDASCNGYYAAREQLASPTASGYSCDFRVLPANPLGSYGQYYSQCLYKLGLVHFSDTGIDSVTSGFAEDLARSVQTTLDKTPFIKNHIFASTKFPETDLELSCQPLGLDALTLPQTQAERRLLIDLFFGWADISVPETDTPFEAQVETQLRRQSLTQILHIVQQHNETRQAPTVDTLDWQLLYGPIYFGTLVNDKGKCAPYTTPPTLVLCGGYWRQFCLHQYITRALELLLWGLLETVALQPGGLTLEETTSRCLTEPFFEILGKTTGRDCNTPRHFLEAVGVREQPTTQSCEDMRIRIGADHSVSEGIVAAMEGTPPEAIAKACLLLAVLYGKWRRVTQEVEPTWFEVKSMAQDEPWAGTILPRLDNWLNPQLTWKECINTLLQEQVVQRYKNVRWSRQQGQNGAWLEDFGGRLNKGRDFSPRWRSSRHSNAFKIMCDLQLLSRNPDDTISLTPEGEKVLLTSLAQEKA